MWDTVLEVNRSLCRERPKPVVHIGIKKKGADHIGESKVMPFGHTILLGCVWNCCLEKDPTCFGMFAERALHELRSIIASNLFDFCVVYVFCKLLELLEGTESLVARFERVKR